MQRLPNDAELTAVERIVEQAIKKECQAFNRKQPEVIVVAYEGNPALAAKIQASLGKAVGSEDKDKRSRKKVQTSHCLNNTIETRRIWLFKT